MCHSWIPRPMCLLFQSKQHLPVMKFILWLRMLYIKSCSVSPLRVMRVAACPSHNGGHPGHQGIITFTTCSPHWIITTTLQPPTDHSSFWKQGQNVISLRKIGFQNSIPIHGKHLDLLTHLNKADMTSWWSYLSLWYDAIMRKLKSVTYLQTNCLT